MGYKERSEDQKGRPVDSTGATLRFVDLA